MDKRRGESGHLVIFDRDASKPWEDRLYRREESLDGRPVTVWGACTLEASMRSVTSAYQRTRP